MTLDELKERTKHLKGDYQLTIRKSDRHQLCCSSTVPIENSEVGVDWTHGQIVLIPEIKLVTDPEIVNKRMEKSLEEYASKCSTYLRILAKLSSIIDGMENNEDKRLLNKVLDEIRNK